jgi:hypothetical protein
MVSPGDESRYHPAAVRRIRFSSVTITLLSILFVLGAAAGCSASTPQSAVGDFISARIAGEDEEAAKLTVEGDLGGYMGGEPFLYAGDVTFDLDPPEVDVDRAVVIVHYRWDDQSVAIPYVARRVGTKWKVALRETESMWLPE